VKDLDMRTADEKHLSEWFDAWQAASVGARELGLTTDELMDMTKSSQPVVNRALRWAKKNGYLIVNYSQRESILGELHKVPVYRLKSPPA
jgi:hypothetical protein